MYQIIKKIVYILPQKDPIKILLLFLLMMIAALLEVAGIGMIPAFVAIVADPERVMEVAVLEPVINLLEISNSQDLLLWGSAALIVVFLIKGLYIVLFNYIEAKFIYRRRYYVSRRMMTAYMQAPYTFHLQKNTAELLRNILNEVNVLSNIILTNLLKMSREGVMTISILILLFSVEPLITLFVLILAGAGAGSFILLTQKKIKSYGEEEQQRRSKMIQAVAQGLGGIKDARVLNRESEFINRFAEESFKSTNLMAFIKFIQQIPKPVVETTAVFGMMLISGFMVWQGRPMSAIIPTLTLFAMALVRLMPSIQQLSSMYTNLQYNMVSLDPIYNDLQQLEGYGNRLVSERSSGNSMEFIDRLELDNVSYRYPESDEQALDKISLDIPKGSSVAFVGESGAGKTTIVDLILGLLEPTNGEIRVDGKNIQDSISAWQKNIGYIPQSIYLADESLRRNVAFGIPENEIDNGKVFEALKMAQLESLIKRLPDGIETIIGEDGTRLSGGQRQRIGIARALYHNPEVLVMDEATSALDNITEKEISKAIDALIGERTIILIAHRLTTVKNCNKLYLMKEGEIMDSGNYDDLVNRNKEFKKMALAE